MAQLAAEAGDPYSADELTSNIDDINRKFNEKYKESLRRVSKDLGDKLDNLSEALKNVETLANWKEKLKHHFRDAMKGDEEFKRSKRVMSQKWRKDRYNPYKERPKTENTGANVFYLIDNSGSMYYYGGNKIFYQIFKEVLSVEKMCKVNMSARAYFSSGVILPENVELWDRKTNTEKILDKLADRGGSGGTDIPGNVLSVTKLKPPYYYSTPTRHTTIIVFTDGENNDRDGWKLLQRIPFKILKDVVFCIFNTKENIMHYMKEIMTQGVPLKNIIGINVKEFEK